MTGDKNMDVAKKYQDELPRIKKNVKNAYMYFKPNHERFDYFRRFVFDTSLDESDKTALMALNKPCIEFNVLEAMISRLRGEFSKQEPSVKVMADDGAEVDPRVIGAVEGHLRHIISDANRSGCEYQIYTDTLSGGFSVIKVWTEYANSMSFNQVIKIGRASDPTLCGFDPLATAPHKGDGRYCFENYPKSREEFEYEYPDIDIRGVSFTRSNEGFNWSYNNEQEDILMICEYYEKKKKKVRIVQTVDKQIMSMDDYKVFVAEWNLSGKVELPPGIMGKPRWTEIEKICRYRFIENQVLEYVETDFSQLPLIFVDGNSILIREGNGGSVQQMTRPYVYHAKGVQKLKNFAGQTLANELENMVQHKFKVAKESLPDEPEYLSAYTNIQIANTLVYKAFSDNDPNVPVPPPQEIQRVPAPPEVTSTFQMTDQMVQSILGSYDASLGINDNQLSGVAIVEGATQSNSAAMPYIVGYLNAWSQMANICLDLIPKYYVTSRTIPVVNPDGSRDFQKINQQGGVSMNYDENALQVHVEAGVNFAIQKSRALQQIIAMSQNSQIFQQFINTKGLKVLLDNFEIRGVDQLKQMADQFSQEMQQQQQQAQQLQQHQTQQQQVAQQLQASQIQAQQQQAQMQNQLAMAKLQIDKQKIDQDGLKISNEGQIDAAKLAIDKQEADIDLLKVMSDIGEAKDNMMIQADKAEAEKTRAAVDLAIKHMDVTHGHMMDRSELQHKINESKKGE